MASSALYSPSKQEISARIESLYERINRQGRDWDAVFLVDKINQYYLTGTKQNGVFVLKRDGSYALFVRRSFERAKLECLIGDIYPMASYKDVHAKLGGGIHNIYIESEVLTHAMLERIRRYFDIGQTFAADSVILGARAVKSEFELACIEESARQHSELFDNIVPGILKEGMSETEFTAELYKNMINLGYHGAARFLMFQPDIMAGQIAFGENALYPAAFDGPGSMRGMHPASPIIGDRSRLLKKGDLVFVDTGYGYNGYHSDRTQVYIYGANPTDEMIKLHRKCVDIQKRAAALLKPGNIPSEIYTAVMDELDADFLQNFMGFSEKPVKFLGHGVGLNVDEFPIIAQGFNEPLEENMVIALEPKKSVEGVGILGGEDTYIVTKDGGRCITGGEKDIIAVK